jgi:beta-carotene 3-hydroxylase
MTVTARLSTVLASFAAMELVSYATHRWVMHGPGMTWHRSHHHPSGKRWERNDLFPLCFAAVGMSLFGLGLVVPPVLAVAQGITLYGVAYGVVHDLVIHRRFGVAVPDWPYVRWLRASHAVHHRFGGEPYGMLLPVVPRRLRMRALRRDGQHA